MCTALSVLDPAVSVGSVQVDAASPFRVRAALTAVRSSVMCTAFTGVLRATTGLSVKPLVLVVAKVAVTEVAALTVTLHVPAPVQAPLQPVKEEPAAGAAVRVTAAPLVNAAEHVVPQETPVGALVTVPLPAPDFITVSVKGCSAKVAVTAWAALIVTLQVPVPVQPPPLQPVKVEPAAGAAVKVT